MSLSIERFYKSIIEYDVKIVAGQKGMNNIAQWFQVADGFEVIEHIEKKSIVFITGIGLDVKKSLLRLIECHIENESSAIILNIGHFISEVPREIIDYCNKKNHPLFTTPWKTSSAKLARVFNYMLLGNKKSGVELGMALKNVITFPLKDELYSGVFNEYGFKENDYYSMVVIEPDTRSKSTDRNSIERMVKSIEMVLMSFGDKSFVINSEGKFIILFSNYKNEDIKHVVAKAHSVLKQIWKEFFIGIGCTLQRQSNISVSYMQAIKSIRLGKNINKLDKIMVYEDLGLYKLLLCIDDNDVLENYHSDMLEKLEKYDKRNNYNCVETLKLYLEKNCSINDVAKILFLHRNTITYKIKKIEQILGCDLSNIDDRVKLYIAFCLKNIIHNK